MEETYSIPDRTLVEELQEKLTMSAEIGKHLLEERESLREQIEVERNEHTAKMEVAFVWQVALDIYTGTIHYYVGNIARKLQPWAQIRDAV